MSWGWLLDPVRAIGAADVLDIAVMAALIYTVVLWFERTRTAFVARGMLMLILFYFAAKLAGMYMTTWVFQGFFAVLLILPVVIFQEDIRRFFERVAVWSMGTGREVWPVPARSTEALVRALGDLARSKTGALLVLKGRDPLLRHVEGGVSLGGEISSPLLESLFDPHSDGHDGAVVIAEGKVSHFAAHLPLSNDFRQLAGKGTRHAAALGLSERTDALCLVVSEEKGTIHGARDGSLFPIKDLTQLEGLLNAFLHERSPHEEALERPGLIPAALRRRMEAGGYFRDLLAAEERLSAYLHERVKLPRREEWRHFLSHRRGQKGVALGLAVALWLVFVKGFKPLTLEFYLPVAAQNLPPYLAVRSIEPPEVAVSLHGTPRDLRALQPRHLKALVDLRGAEAGLVTVAIDEEALRIPSGLRLVSVSPETVEIGLVPAGSKAPPLARRGREGGAP